LLTVALHDTWIEEQSNNAEEVRRLKWINDLLRLTTAVKGGVNMGWEPSEGKDNQPIWRAL
jgi:hypothetical protein